MLEDPEKYPHGWDVMPVRAYQVFIVVVLLPFIFIKNLRALSPFSYIANILTLIGLIIILQWSLQNLHPVSDFQAFNSWTKLALYFGTTIYAFEGIGVVSGHLFIINRYRGQRIAVLEKFHTSNMQPLQLAPP